MSESDYLGIQMAASRLMTRQRQKIFEQLDKDYISGITFSGGDPLYEANRADVTALAKEIKERYPKKRYLGLHRI